MARFEFRDENDDEDDDDDDDTDYDSPSKEEQWDNNQQPRKNNNNNHFQRNHYGEQEEGEIIEDESDNNEMDISDDYGNNVDHNNVSPNWNSRQNLSADEYQQHRHGEESPQGRSFRSYFPWRKNNNNRNTRSNRSESIDLPEDSSLRDEDDGYNTYNMGNSSSEGNQEYRLIASSKYDRNYYQSDFYPSGIPSNNTSHESSNHNNNNYSNPVSDDDDDENDVYQNEGNNNRGAHHQQHSDGTLVRSNQNSSNGAAPEVHYHIYISEQQASRWFDSSENGGPPRLSEGETIENGKFNNNNNKQRLVLWKRMTLLAGLTQLIMFLVARFDLVTISPPPSYLTWDEYKSHQFRLVYKVSKEGYSLLKHLATTTLTKNNDDDDDDIENYASSRFAFPKTWKSLSPPIEPIANEKSKQENTITIFGQDEALDHLRTSLNEWSSSRNFYKAKHYWNREGRSSSNSIKEPLVIYASGGSGVGKRSLAYLLLEQLHEAYDDGDAVVSAVEECVNLAEMTQKNSFQDTTTLQEYYCPLLHLSTTSDYDIRNQHIQYADEEYDAFDNNHDDDLLSAGTYYQRILDHVVAAGGGASIVLLENVDTPTLGNSWLNDLVSEIRSQTCIFGNTIFVLTSQVGTNTVEKWTRKRLQSLQGEASVTLSGNTEVESLLRYELGRYHGDDDDDDIRATPLGVEDWLLVPMSPLDKNSMSLILQNIASGNQNPLFDGTSTASSIRYPIILTESASERILEALEWHQWIHKTTGDVLRIWSPDGVPPLLKLWEERVLERIESLSNCPRMTTSTVEERSLVLDFEGSSTDRLELRTCQLVTEKDGYFDIESYDKRRWNCRGVSCSFYL